MRLGGRREVVERGARLEWQLLRRHPWHARVCERGLTLLLDGLERVVASRVR